MTLDNLTREDFPQLTEDDQGEPNPTTVEEDSLTRLVAASTIRKRAALPRYTKLAQLGSGGMSTVLLSRDEALDRDVAVKTLSASLRGDPMMTGVLSREALIQSRLEHPAIPPVYDIGIDADGTSFFAMRRIEGVALDAVLRRLRRGDPTYKERYAQRRLLTAFSTVCGAVAFAHSKGVLHRDLKPGNIMFGDFGAVYLLDFGVAKTTAAGDEPWGENALVGTIGYVAPEQLLCERVDERTDIYALGAVLFEVLTYERLHSPETHVALGTTLEGVETRIRARSSQLGVPPELEALCVRATAVRPEDRLSSASEFREAIERFLDGERDIARRHALAEEYAQDASNALLHAAALTAKGAPLTRALRDTALDLAQRAVALEPMNPVAANVLAQLATTTRPGPDAERSQQAVIRGLRQLLFRQSTVLFATWLAGLAVAATFGVRHWSVAVGAVLATLIAGAFVLIRHRNDATWIRIAVFAAGLVAALFTSLLFGPFLVMPGYLASLAVIAIASTLPSSAVIRPEPRRLRVYFFMAIAVTMLAPIALEWFGVVPRSMTFRDGAIVIVPRGIDFPPVPTLIFLVLSNAMAVLLPAIVAMRARDYAFEVERGAFESASTLSQLVPHPLRAATCGSHSRHPPRCRDCKIGANASR